MRSSLCTINAARAIESDDFFIKVRGVVIGCTGDRRHGSVTEDVLFRGGHGFMYGYGQESPFLVAFKEIAMGPGQEEAICALVDQWSDHCDPQSGLPSGRLSRWAGAGPASPGPRNSAFREFRVSLSLIAATKSKAARSGTVYRPQCTDLQAS